MNVVSRISGCDRNGVIVDVSRFAYLGHRDKEVGQSTLLLLQIKIGPFVFDVY